MSKNEMSIFFRAHTARDGDGEFVGIGAGLAIEPGLAGDEPIHGQ